ncbi:MAG: transcription termination/antitermination protein NusG, partial [Nitrospinaceae bacterium]
MGNSDQPGESEKLAEPETTSESETETETETETESGSGSESEKKLDGFKWYIAKTMTGQENKVTRALKERVVNHKLTEYFLEIMTPEESVTSSSKGKKRTIKKKFFPGYVLIKMIMNDRTWHLVKNTDKITGFVGGTLDKPEPITDKEAAYITDQSEDGIRKQRTTVDFSEGETVKVVEGPFTSFVGTVETVSDKGKIKVNVSIFGRPTP